MSTSGEIGVQKVSLPAPRLGELRAHLMLVYTGVRRVAHEILEEQLDRTRQGALVEELRLVGDLVDQGLEVLTDGGAIARFGELLDAAWRAKQRLSSKVTSSQIDAIYQRARAVGAIGGKLVGAGAGGFLLLFVPPACRDGVTRALPELHSVTFDFDHEGSRLLFYHP
jgi:D-glycero-alpha-D-manno-heptose-7-phosphate kinase